MQRVNNDSNLAINFARLSSVFAIIVGSVTIIGWMFYLSLPKELLPYLFAIKINTALCFILAGIAMWLQTDPDNIYSYYTTIVCASTILILGALTLFEYSFNTNYGIDQGAISEKITGMQTFSAGRMSPIVAVNFIMLGFTLILSEIKHFSVNIKQFIILIIICITLYEFLNHLINIKNSAEYLLGKGDMFSQMALPTSLTFLFLALGMLLSRPHEGIISILSSSYSGGMIARRLLPTAIILPIILGYLGFTGNLKGYYQPEVGITIAMIGAILLFGALIIFNAYLIDTADRKREIMESTIKLHQTRLQSILDHTTAIININDLNNQYQLINKQFEKIIKMKSNDILGKTARELFGPEFANTLLENHQKILETLSPLEVVENIVFDGKEHIYLSNKFPILNEDGTPYAIGTVSSDITKLKEMETILKDKKDQLSIALKASGAALWVWHLNEDKIDWDKNAYHLFNKKPEEMPKSFQDLINLIMQEDRNRIKQETNEMLREGSIYNAEFKTSINDTIKFYNTRGKIYRDKNNSPIKLTGIIWDITNFKIVSEELKKSKEMAEAMANKAHKASNAKSLFLAAMSHEIRTPLNGVIAITDLLNNTMLSNEQRDYVDIIRTSGKMLLAVINDILDLSKIESGKLDLKNESFDIHDLITKSIEIVATQNQKKNVSISSYVENIIPRWLIGDSSRIRQILTNLINNALKFTDKGQITVEVTLGPNDSEDSNICNIQILITDTGIGISNKDIKNLFKPFSQADATITSKYGGTGLGLAISKHLSELMGGKITVTSMPQEGSKFLLNLPLNIAKEHFEDQSIRAAIDLSGKHILCIDNNEVVCSIIQKETEGWGMICDATTSSDNAVNLINAAVKNNNPYQLIMIDYHLTAANGTQLIKIIKNIPEMQNIPIIALTIIGDKIPDDAENKINIQAQITKPINQYKLYSIVASVLLTRRKDDRIKALYHSNRPAINSNTKTKILLVEDNLINQKIATYMIAKLGYPCTIASSGQEAIDAIRSNIFDIILMDCQMPNMDGYMTTKYIRQYQTDNRVKRIPIIAVTAYTMKGDKEKCIASGMDDFISKPIDIEELKKVILRWCAHSDFNKHPGIDLANDNRLVQPSTILNIGHINNIFSNDTASIQEFLGLLLSSTANILNSIKEDLKNADYSAIATKMHQLSGSTGNSGAVQFYELCIILENIAKEENWESFRNQFEKLNDEFTVLKNTIHQEYHV